MSEKVALIGFVPSEEIITDTINRQSPGAEIDAYEVFPNEAFGRIATRRFQLYGFPNNSELELDLSPLDELARSDYSAIHLGPDTAVMVTGERMDELNIDYIGPTSQQLDVELDKTKISDIFPNESGILPPTAILTKEDLHKADSVIDQFGGKAILKFVGEYGDYYSGSVYQRVSKLSDFGSKDELNRFMNNSIEASGKVIIQKFIEGQQFSYSCYVDQNGGQFPLGENIFYKNRFEGETGPLVDGAGSVAINNTLPGIVDEEDKAYIRNGIVGLYAQKLGDQFGRNLKTCLNVDLIKGLDGKIYLLEINNRQPGGHTMSNLLTGLQTPILEVLQATQENRLNELDASYKEGAGLVVSVFPEISPADFENPDERPIATVPKLSPEDDIRMYTGWVDVLQETPESVTVQSNLTATFLFATHAEDVKTARKKLYERISTIAFSGFAYRQDIGTDFS